MLVHHMFSFISLPARYKRALSAPTSVRSTTHIPLLTSLSLHSRVYIARPSETHLVALLLPQPPQPANSLLLTMPAEDVLRCVIPLHFPWLTYSVRSETWGGQQEHKSCAYLYVVPGISIPLQLQSREAGSGGEETEGTNVKGSPPVGDEARSLKWLPKDQDTRLGDFHSRAF